MCRGRDDLLDIVLFSCGLAGDSSASSVLSLVAVYSLALDVTEMWAVSLLTMAFICRCLTPAL